MRLASVDFFRGLAIVSVVLVHAGLLPFGYLGVDIFFVISGYLVSQPLLKALNSGQNFSISVFVIKRTFKIIPSYYFFLLAGSILSLVFLAQPFREGPSIWQYLLFVRNYAPPPHFWPFDHLWSLCVEEHFYLLLPFSFFVLSRQKKNKERFLLIAICSVILLSITSKLVGYLTGIGEYTYYSHNRMDALAWGVLLAYLQIYSRIDSLLSRRKLVLVFSVFAFCGSLYVSKYFSKDFFVFFLIHTTTPALFFLILASTLFLPFSDFGFIKSLAPYSYNWYLWHPIVKSILDLYIDDPTVLTITYFSISFMLAVLFTKTIEEFFMAIRSKFLTRHHATAV